MEGPGRRPPRPPPKPNTLTLKQSSSSLRPGSRVSGTTLLYNGSNSSAQISPTTISNPDTPHGKTAIGSLFFRLSNLPLLHLFRVTVHAMDGNRQEIRSRKLRRLAMEEFLENEATFKNLKDYFAINAPFKPDPHKLDAMNPEDQKKHHDNIIIPQLQDVDLQPLLDCTENRELEFMLPKLKKRDRSSRVEVSIRCVIRSHKILQEGEDGYGKHFKLLMQSLASTSRQVRAQAHAHQWDFMRVLPKGIENTTINPSTLLQAMPTLQARLHFQPKFDPDHPTELRLNVNIVASIREKRVSDVLFDLFGTSIVAPDLENHLPHIRRMLLGLRVKCEYKPKHTRKTKPGSNNRTPTDHDLHPLERFGVINDIKLPGEVEKFSAVNDKGVRKLFTVAQYFNEVIIPRDSTSHSSPPLRYHSLPYANIGRPEPGQQAWVPLEKLQVAPPQTLHGCGYLTEELKAVGRALFPKGSQETGSQHLRTAGNTFKDAISKIKGKSVFEVDLISTNPAPHLRPSESVEVTRNGRRDAANTVSNTVSRTAVIVYIGPAGLTPAKQIERSGEISTHMEDLKRRVNESSIVNLNFLDTVIVWRGEDIVSQQDEGRSDIRKIIKSDEKAEVVLGIVDQRGRTKSELKKIYAELSKFGNRKIGAVTVCTTRQSLDDLIAQKEDPNYFPQNILRKVNFMLGGKNFDTAALRALEEPLPERERPQVEFTVPLSLSDAPLGLVAEIHNDDEPQPSQLTGQPEHGSSPEAERRAIIDETGHGETEQTDPGGETTLPRPEQLMVVGAHIAHSDPHAVRYCPSVAAVVSSVDGEATHYPGSARVQARLEKHPRAPENRPTQKTVIEEFQGMMLERFQSWKENNITRADQAPRGVLFYRDGYCLDVEGDRVMMKELTDIQRAYTATWSEEDRSQLNLPEQIPVTYVLININSLGERPRISSNIMPESSRTPAFMFSAGPIEKPEKYKYTVLENGLSLQQSTVEALTSDLNHSSQLAREVAISLPVFFAQKLCRRMYDYIYHYQTSDSNDNPEMIRFLKEGDLENSLNMSKVVNEYLFASGNFKEPPKSKSTGTRRLPWNESLDKTMFYL